MAERFLKTLKLPGIDEPYKIPQTAEDVGARSADWLPTPEEIGAATPADIAAAAKAAPRNLLDNSDFRNPVNQRGVTSVTANGYNIDRWRTYSATDSVTVGDGFISLSARLYQVIPADKIDVTKTYTAVAMRKDGTLLINVVKGISETQAGEPTLYVASQGVLFRVTINGGDFLWAALYEGEYTAETLPEYRPKGYGAELLECYRYYYRATNDLGLFYPAAYIGTNGIYFVLSLPTKMRVITPTVTAKIMRVVSLPEYSVPEGFTYTFVSDGGNQLRIGAIKSAHGLAHCMFEINGIEISADL